MQDKIKKLDSLSVDLAQLASVVDWDVHGTDLSNNLFANQVKNTSPLFSWLINTALSDRLRNAWQRGNMQIDKNPDTGDFEFVAPYIVYTDLPTDTTGVCCWVPFNLSKCGQKIPLKLLCIKDCRSIQEKFIEKSQRFQPYDLINSLIHRGETYDEARKRIVLESFAFYTIFNVLNGTLLSNGPVLKPFNGLVEELYSDTVVKILGGNNILGAFDTLACRLSVLGRGERIFAMHPLIYQTVEQAIIPGRFGIRPPGWRESNGVIYFRDIRLLADEQVTFDPETGLGDIWMLDSQTVGAHLDLAPGATSPEYEFHDFGSTDDPDLGCAAECDYYYNQGAVASVNPNRVAVITGVGANSACTGSALEGLDGLIKPTTLIPL
ncbi:hypothetical protein FACS189418_6860 [Clostridia bacterium]|nr:hypothetical protein FACS189418_6860 [Clostridia bacterium]